MKKLITAGLAALTLAGGAVAAASPAAAAPGWHGGYGGYHGGWHGGGWGAGAAVGAGLLGLAVGASLAHPYYGPAYYAPGPAYAYYGGCRTHLRWNPYWGGYERVRVCY